MFSLRSKRTVRFDQEMCSCSFNRNQRPPVRRTEQLRRSFVWKVVPQFVHLLCSTSISLAEMSDASFSDFLSQGREMKVSPITSHRMLIELTSRTKTKVGAAASAPTDRGHPFCLGYHTQVACICQLLSSPDYNIIFKTLQENYMNDDIDDYYECIWDLALLESLIST